VRVCVRVAASRLKDVRGRAAETWPSALDEITTNLSLDAVAAAGGWQSPTKMRNARGLRGDGEVESGSPSQPAKFYISK
jgi:hypothetical protein